MMPILVVDFDGFLNPMPDGWFDIGTYKHECAQDAIKFLIDATEFFTIAIYGPRSLMFGGIQTIQAAIIEWTTMQVNKATMHDLMAVLNFPDQMPETYAVAVNASGVNLGPTKDALSRDQLEFINYWQARIVGPRLRKE